MKEMTEKSDRRKGDERRLKEKNKYLRERVLK
jgi:hypothetical protein